MALATAPVVRAVRASALPLLESEVCIIGSGPAGAILGCALARRGVAVLLVESGPPAGAPRDARYAALDRYRCTGPLAYEIGDTRLRGAGGTSNLWTGACPRLYPLDFEPNACTPPGAPWPLRYEELAPYYEAAEAELQVRTDIGRTENIERLLQRRGVDLALHMLPRSRRDGGPVRMADTHLPEMIASPSATLLTDATATRVAYEADGRVAGIHMESFTQAPRRVRANAYVIACGGIETARLLLASGRSGRSDQVGRNFMEHPLAVRGEAAVDTDFDLAPASEMGSTAVFLADAKRRGLGGVRIDIIADTLHTDRATPSRRLAVQVRAEIECAPAAANRITLSRGRDPFGMPGADLWFDFTAQDRRTIGHAETVVRAVLGRLGVAHPRITTGALSWGHHHMGTCRMGEDPRTSVLDRNLRVHGTDSLYVAGSAPFVTSGVSNPTLTIAALSLRLADHLADTLRRR
jgi:choline dehydrogenase-like flavoprotein